MNLKELLPLEHSFFDIHLFNLAGTPVTPGSLGIFVLILLASYLASRILQRMLERTLVTRGKQAIGTVGVLGRLLHYLVMAVGLGVGLQTIGINLGALFAAGAVFAIGIGLAMQNLVQNFISGIILMLERAIRPGDVLHLEERMVKVERMGVRATIVRTLDDEQMILPNSTLVQSVVTNYTMGDTIYRLRTVVGVSYGSDMDQVRRVLEETAAGLDWKSDTRAPTVLLTQFGSSSVDWEVSVWLEDPWITRRCRSRLNQAIWWALKEAGITIAFPQLDLHLDPPVTRSLDRLPAPSPGGAG